MNYYLRYKDVFINEDAKIIPDVNDICKWYFYDNNKFYNLKFTNSLTSKHCRKMYDSIYEYTVNGKDNTVVNSIDNVALNVFKILVKDDIKQTYIPVVSTKGYAGCIHLLTKDNTIVDTAFTREKFKLTNKLLEYYRLKLGLLYYLLDIEKDYGYFMHISSIGGIKRQYIDGVYNKQRCEAIINAYLGQNRAQGKADISKTDILLYKTYNASKCLKLLLN